MPKLCPNITFPHQQDFFPIRSVTKYSTARFSHENLVEKFKIFVQDFVPIRTALTATRLLTLQSTIKTREIISHKTRRDSQSLQPRDTKLLPRSIQFCIDLV